MDRLFCCDVLVMPAQVTKEEEVKEQEEYVTMSSQSCTHCGA